jgi:hypothetical protein
MSNRKLIAVFTSHIKRTNTPYTENVELLDTKPGGINSGNWALKVLIISKNCTKRCTVFESVFHLSLELLPEKFLALINT